MKHYLILFFSFLVLNFSFAKKDTTSVLHVSSNIETTVEAPKADTTITINVKGQSIKLPGTFTDVGDFLVIGESESGVPEISDTISFESVKELIEDTGEIIDAITETPNKTFKEWLALILLLLSSGKLTNWFTNISKAVEFLKKATGKMKTISVVLIVSAVLSAIVELFVSGFSDFNPFNWVSYYGIIGLLAVSLFEYIQKPKGEQTA